MEAEGSKTESWAGCSVDKALVAQGHTRKDEARRLGLQYPQQWLYKCGGSPVAQSSGDSNSGCLAFAYFPRLPILFEFARKEVIIVLNLFKKTSAKFNTNVLNITTQRLTMLLY